MNQRVEVAIENFQEALESKQYYQNGSTAQRIGLTIYGYEVFKDSPIFGVGTGDHMDILREKIPEEEVGLKKIAKPHNVYIQILMQHGILGALLFIYLIYSILSYKVLLLLKKM